MLNSKSIGDKIATVRKKTNLSQAEIAQQLFISPQAVGKWERGESMPDIATLSRLAEIFGVDLNYFSDRFQRDEVTTIHNEKFDQQTVEIPKTKPREKFDWNWDMSQGNWVDADFSGLKNLKEKFSSSNIKNSKFLDSELSGLILKSNHIENCDFSDSDMRNSKIQTSYLSNNIFIGCSLIDTEFTKTAIRNCNFLNANFSGAEFLTSDFQKNTIEKAVWEFTSFKDSSFSDIVFDGTIKDCSFENCGFKKVKFKNATLTNTFFKNNSKLKQVQFIDCKVDNLTYAFLKNGKADLTGITLLPGHQFGKS